MAVKGCLPMKIVHACFLLLLCGFAVACAPLGPDLRECRRTVEDFAHTLRWQRYDEGALFFAADQRPGFQAALIGRRDLQITDVRVLNVSPDARDRCGSAVLEMDYYILPSVTLRTLRIEQNWASLTEGPASGRGLRIVTPFPAIP